MAKAICCITGCNMVPGTPGKILIGAHVRLDVNFASPPDIEVPNGYGLNMQVDHGSSGTQVVLALRNRIISDVTSFGGPALGLTDIQVFGGPV